MLYSVRIRSVILNQEYVVFFLMIRRPPRSTQSRSSAASDVYKRQVVDAHGKGVGLLKDHAHALAQQAGVRAPEDALAAVSYTHLRAHETVLDLVCRLLLEKKNKNLLTCLSHTPYPTSSPHVTTGT